MNQIQRILLFFVLPLLATVLLPPEYFGGAAFLVVIPLVILMAVLGYFLLRGRSTALTLMIFVLGFNVIVRLMMFFPHFTQINGSVDFLFVISSVASIALSTYMLLRLDRVDVRVQMVK
jgi:hypothetical protein